MSLTVSCLCLIDRQLFTSAFMVGWTGVSDPVTTAVDVTISLHLQTYTKMLGLACKEISILFVAIAPQFRW